MPMNDQRRVEIVDGQCRDDECGAVVCAAHPCNERVRNGPDGVLPDVEGTCTTWVKKELSVDRAVDALATLRASVQAMLDHIHQHREPIDRGDEQELLRQVEEALGVVDTVGLPLDPQSLGEMMLSACGWRCSDKDEGHWYKPGLHGPLPMRFAASVAASEALR